MPAKQSLNTPQNIIIAPLTKKNLSQAGTLVDNTFPENDVPPSVGITASLNDSVRVKLNQKHHGSFNWFKYWVAIDQTSEGVVGIVGIYEESFDAKEACWLGWFCIHPQHRSKGIGKILLKHAISNCRALEKPFLRVYTSNNQSRIPAVKLYTKMGFRPMKSLPINSEADQLYFELAIKS